MITFASNDNIKLISEALSFKDRADYGLHLPLNDDKKLICEALSVKIVVTSDFIYHQMMT